MNDISYSGSAINVRVRLDPELMRDLAASGLEEGAAPRDDKARLAVERAGQLRELLIYRLLRSIVGEFNTKFKGRRERFKLVEEGDGLFLEFQSG